MGKGRNIMEIMFVLTASSLLTKTIFQIIGFDVNYSTEGGITLNEILTFNVEMVVFTLSIIMIYTLIVPRLYRARGKIPPASLVH